ncbi:MAG: Mrp/NBP35 family ATP-binding protein [Candidatus Zixiibacteriota bacterium]|nr:MAG: Mrp/NBP35 family ATP-binding protein [candidate division Zixibacteria bacterium]
MMEKEKFDTELVMSRLAEVYDPELNRSIVELGMVERIEAKDGRLTVKIKLTIPGCPLKNRIQSDIEKALSDIPEIREIKIDFSAMTAEERKNLTKQLKGKDPSESFARKNVKNVILVASGKGGVGKSTVTVNLAAAVARRGFKVGVLDADIYGFSIPRMLGIKGAPTVIDNTIIPLDSYGIKVISMGFFISESESVIWRGPLVHKAVTQFLSDVYWDDLDYLFIDLPPGTGDVALSVANTAKGVNSILVTTPQPGAYMVASRIGQLVDKFDIKMLGVVENMSYFLAPDGKKEYIFGTGGGTELSERMRIPLLGQIPLETAIREGGDLGKPIALSDNSTPASVEFGKIAEKIIAAAG